MLRKRWTLGFATFILIGITLFTACAKQASPPFEAITPSVEKIGVAVPAWVDIELADVASGEKFRISDFKGKPVLLESFAVWCPTCLLQQKQINALEKNVGESIILISIDTDPNEDEDRVREHIEKQGFDWHFVVAPIELTRALLDDFGFTVVSAPMSPIVLICQDQSARLLRNGVKSPDDLLAEIEKGCG